MERATKLEVKVSKERIIDEDNPFVLIEASKLSLDDKFMQHRGQEGKSIQWHLERSIKNGLRDFYIPRYAPSFTDDDHTKIQFVPGKKQALGKSFDWWKKTCEEFCPERGSHLGCYDCEYVAFLGILIKMLVENGHSVEEAWWLVCEHPERLIQSSSGNKFPSNDDTGSNCVCGFYDLFTSKIMKCNYFFTSKTMKCNCCGDNDCFRLLFGWSYMSQTGCQPSLTFAEFGFQHDFGLSATGWLVLSSN